MKYVINLIAIVLISMMTSGCSLYAIGRKVEVNSKTWNARVKTETRQTQQISRRDLRLGFNSTGDSFSVQLQYQPYYNMEKRDIFPETTRSESMEAYVVIAYVVASAVLWRNVMADEGPKEPGSTWWSRKEDWKKTLAIAIPADWLMFWPIVFSGGSRYGGRWAWQPTEGEIAGEWQALGNHPYRIDLPTYNFGKEYRSTSGSDRILLREFLDGIQIRNPEAFLKQHAFTLRASTELDGKRYEKPLRITTQTGLQPFRDTARAALGFDMITTGTPRLSPRAEAVAQWTKGTITAGQTATLIVTVKNTGKGTLFQVKALTVSSNPIFNNKELRFGKIVPGASKTLQYTFEIDKLMRTRDIPLRIRFSEYNDYVPEDIEAKLHVVGQPRPKFDYNYRVVDGGTRDSVGNGDGIFQRGESVDIQVTVRNSGPGPATGVNTRLKLRSTSGVTQYGASEKRFASITPGTSRTTTFNIGVTPRSTARSLILDLVVSEEKFGTEVQLRDKITLPIGQMAAPKIAVLDVNATITADTAILRDGADSSTPVLAEIPKNMRVHITGQLGSWYCVELNEITGWIQARELRTGAIAATQRTTTQNQKVQIVKVFQKQAPVLTLVEPGTSQVSVEERTLSLTATASDDEGIARIELTVNGKVVEKAGRGMRAAPAKNRTIKETISLKYGKNTIRLVVYDTDGQASQPLVIVATRTRERSRQDYALLFATDRYDAWEPLKNPIHDAQTVGNELENRYGFSVELVQNPTRAEIFSKLREYGQKRYNSDDQLLVFFAGHGHFDEVFGAGYLIAKDSSDAERDPSMTSAIQHSQLHQIIDNNPCEHIFLVIDACFSGTFDERVAQRGRRDDTLYEGVERDEFIKRTLETKTRRYLTSGGKEYVSDGRSGAHSPFARNMLEALRSDGGKDGILTLNELEGYVEKTEPQPQASEFGDNEPGSNFLFIRK